MTSKLKITALFTAAAVSVIAVTAGMSENANSPLVILAGQSNALGPTSDAAHLPSLPDGKLWWIDGATGPNDWVAIGPQPGRFQAGHFGPEIGIANEIENVSIFKFAVGATSLARDWTPGKKTGLLVEMLDSLRTATSTNDSLFPYCFVFVQGESDAETAEFSASYDRRLQRLIQEVRNVVSDDTPIVLSVDELHPWVVNNPEVVNAQKTIADSDPLIEFVSFSDLEKADTTHLVASATLTQGTRYAKACKRLNEACRRTEGSCS